jgi:AraC-like DNA-binding protein
MFALEDLRVARYAAGGSMPAHVHEMASLNLDPRGLRARQAARLLCRLFKAHFGVSPSRYRGTRGGRSPLRRLT